MRIIHGEESCYRNASVRFGQARRSCAVAGSELLSRARCLAALRGRGQRKDTVVQWHIYFNLLHSYLGAVGIAFLSGIHGEREIQPAYFFVVAKNRVAILNCTPNEALSFYLQLQE